MEEDEKIIEAPVEGAEPAVGVEGEPAEEEGEAEAPAEVPAE